MAGSESEAIVELDETQPQLTLRAVATGMILGGVLSVCNIYSGLKIGWGFNMSVTACLLGWALWRGLGATLRTSFFGPLENNLNQTAASSAASVSSAGLVAGVPALTMLTGYEWRYHVLVVWIFVVSMVGIVVAIGLRKQMIIIDKLPFPNGIAAGETIKSLYAEGAGAMRRVMALIGAAGLSGLTKLVTYWRDVHNALLPASFAAPGALAASGAGRLTLANLGFSLDPSALLLAVGALVGVRAAASMMLGALVAWGVLAPWVLAMGWAHPPASVTPDGAWYADILKWLLWPGVGMMVSASLTSFAFSWRSVLAAVRPRAGDASVEDPGASADVPRRVFLGSLALVLALATIAQVALFGIRWWTAAIGVLVTFVLAIVAGRVSGETNVTPVGAMGKVTQLLFGVIEPGQAAANLMSATVTGGAASQCADLLFDLKTGSMLGASPRAQALAQSFGALAGAVMGCAGYLVLLPDPVHQIPSEWSAPAVQTWAAVARIFMEGVQSMPAHALEAMTIGAAAGIVLALLEKLLPKRIATWVPSPTSLGLAFVIPAYNSISMFIGALIALAVSRAHKRWSEKYVIITASGLIAGESLMGVSIAIWRIVSGH